MEEKKIKHALAALAASGDGGAGGSEPGAVGSGGVDAAVAAGGGAADAAADAPDASADVAEAAGAQGGRVAATTLVRLGALKDIGAVTVEWMNTMITRGAQPSKRHSHSAVVVGADMYVFGGSISMKERVADMHCLNLETLAWSRVGLGDDASAAARSSSEVPDTRYAHSAVAVGTSIYIFGGSHYSIHGLNDMYVFDTLTSTWSRVATVGIPPTRRYYHATAVVGTDIYIFGGFDGSPRVSDVHVFRTLTSTWEAITTYGPHPSPRHGHTAVTCPAFPGTVFLYGGFDGSQPWSNELFVYDTVTATFSRPDVRTSLHRSFDAIVASVLTPDTADADADADAEPSKAAATDGDAAGATPTTSTEAKVSALPATGSGEARPTQPAAARKPAGSTIAPAPAPEPAAVPRQLGLDDGAGVAMRVE
ncbi:kelch repeat protein [Thecamonas trahens ATCC 50062]|uniref:Kelch repeat protein n=1 Tax=Thecamonas trahens ATCC 50062 TaxID=461836 RepID=A0A0L0DNE9_THETB|nr:kelch repeat protein [Thecamonas trahens ATCC 50062]KNC53834.1 kelch repeat protein [Thecamonas trahens ATCC 50062]|eukprot:XP_013754217.1 kelch repeat protein [Thecamonas trahens ATCC 50062]